MVEAMLSWNSGNVVRDKLVGVGGMNDLGPEEVVEACSDRRTDLCCGKEEARAAFMFLTCTGLDIVGVSPGVRASPKGFICASLPSRRLAVSCAPFRLSTAFLWASSFF